MDWNAIKTEYITTSISYRKLAEKYGVPFITLSQRARKEKWAELRRKHNDRIITKTLEKAEAKAVDYKSMLYDLAYKVAKQLVEMTDRTPLDKLALIGIKPRDITGAIKDLEDALHIKSESDLKEQEARIAKLRREAMVDNNEDGNRYGVLVLPAVEPLEEQDTNE